MKLRNKDLIEYDSIQDYLNESEMMVWVRLVKISRDYKESSLGRIT